MIHLPEIELEELEGAITNLESPRPQQYDTGLLRSLLTKLKEAKKLEQTFIDLLDHIGNRFEYAEYNLEATPENIAFVELAEEYTYGKERAPIHIDSSNQIWTGDLVLLDYLIHRLEHGKSICKK